MSETSFTMNYHAMSLTVLYITDTQYMFIMWYYTDSVLIHITIALHGNDYFQFCPDLVLVSAGYDCAIGCSEVYCLVCEGLL